MKYAFMRAHQDQFKVSRMYRAFQISRSGYYGWRNRKESKRSEQNRTVLVEIPKVHEENREAYGAVKTWRELKAQGLVCGRYRVARLRAWVGDITFIATASGWLYLAVLLDLYSRRVVGWAMSERIDQQLVLDALNMVLGQGRPQSGLIHHTDQGRQYSTPLISRH